MTVSISNTAANGALDALATAWGATPKLIIYSGTAPTNTGTALSGNTALATVTLAPAAASAGSKDMLGGVQTVTASATGVAAFYRVYNSGITTCHEQGSVGTTATDVIIDNTSINNAQSVKFNSFTKTWPNTP
jgi:predicted amidohydrolase